MLVGRKTQSEIVKTSLVVFFATFIFWTPTPYWSGPNPCTFTWPCGKKRNVLRLYMFHTQFPFSSGIRSCDLAGSRVFMYTCNSTLTSTNFYTQRFVNFSPTLLSFLTYSLNDFDVSDFCFFFFFFFSSSTPYKNLALASSLARCTKYNWREDVITGTIQQEYVISRFYWVDYSLAMT